LKLTAQEEYGRRCLMQVERCSNGSSVTIPEISQAEGLSLPNVAKMMRLLRLGGVVQSSRGQSGGYALATSAGRISLAEVLNCLGDPMYSPRFCVNHSGEQAVCPHSPDCSIRPMWRTVQEVLSGVFQQLTLQDLLSDENEMSCRIACLPVAIPRQRDQH